MKTGAGRQTDIFEWIEMKKDMTDSQAQQEFNRLLESVREQTMTMYELLRRHQNVKVAPFVAFHLGTLMASLNMTKANDDVAVQG